MPFLQLLIEHRKADLRMIGTYATNPTAGYLTGCKMAGMMTYRGFETHFYYWCEETVSPMDLDGLIAFIMQGIDRYVTA